MISKILGTLVFAGYLLFSTPQAFGQEERIAAVAVDVCKSEHLKEIIAAIECERTNCPDPDGSKDSIYHQACTEIHPDTVREVGGDAVRVDIDPSTRLGIFYLVNESYPTIEILTRTRITNPVKQTVLSPCDCLAKIEAKVKCNLALCKPDPVPPAPQNPPPNPEPAQPGKEVSPDRAQPVLEGGGLCSLGSGAGNMDILGWILMLFGSGLLSYRRKQS